MLTTLLLLTALFFVLAFILTERNAKYLLSGYNTMSEDQRKQLDLPAFLKFHKRFHILLAISYGLIGFGLYTQDTGLILSLFIGIYPLVAYIYFLWKSVSFWKSASRKSGRAGIVILLVVLVGVVVLMMAGLKNDHLTIDGSNLSISGMYSVDVPVSEIESVDLLDEMPDIRMKTNGFATGPVKKGYFILKDAGTAKLILNSVEAPFIRINLKGNETIYYSLNSEENEVIYQQIQAAISK